MVSADETPIRGSGSSNEKAERQGKKSEKQAEKQSEKRSRKPRQKVAANPEQTIELPQEITALIAGVDSSATEPHSSATETSQVESARVELSPGETASLEPHVAESAPADPAPTAAVSLAPAPVNLQTIGNAVGDYTLKTFEQTSSFFEQLAGARSFGRAVELQTQYARQAIETFVAESEKIHELHREMARQRWQRLEGLVSRTKASAK